MPKMVFDARVMGVFEAHKTNYELMNNLMQDVALGRELYDAENEKVLTKAEANAKILAFSRDVLGITNIKDRKEVRRALRDNGRVFYDIIEDTIDTVVSVSFQESEWFNALVDQINLSYGDRQDFIVKTQDAILAVAKVGESHHDHILQRLRAGQRFSVSTARYGVKVGADINKYLLGDVDWTQLIEAIAKAFILKIQEEIYAEVDSAAAKLPVQEGFVGTGTLAKGVMKDKFDQIIENVSDANDGADVVIMGTKSALRKLTVLADVTWADEDAKKSVTHTGRLGDYEGTTLVEVPNRFKDKTFTTKVFNSGKLIILPKIDDRFIKFVDEGDTEIVENTEKGEGSGRIDDVMSYEVQRRFGVATVIGRQFGQWTLS